MALADGLLGISKSFTKCGHNSRPFLCGYKYVHDGIEQRARAHGYQTVRSNEQMMQSMKGATALLGSMNRQMNLPALQRIAMEFEKENDIMDQRQEMMDDAIDDVTGLEDEEEGEEVVNQVLDEIGVDLGQAVRAIRRRSCTAVCVLTRPSQLGETPSGLQKTAVGEGRVAQAVGGAGGDADDDDLQARLDSLRR